MCESGKRSSVLEYVYGFRPISHAIGKLCSHFPSFFLSSIQRDEGDASLGADPGGGYWGHGGMVKVMTIRRMSG